MPEPRTQLVVPIGDDTLVVGRRNLWLAIFVVLLLVAASMTGVLTSLRLVSAFEHANAVHRARNEASHICIVETIGEGRHRAQRQMDWSARESVEFYEECVNVVAPTLIPPGSVRSPLRFQRPSGRTIPTPTPAKSKRPATPAPTLAPSRAGGYIYVPPPTTPQPTPVQSHPSTPAPSPSRPPTATPAPTPCDPACPPTVPPV